jgi:O-antigen ligase
MRSALAIDSEARRRLAAAGILLVAALCFIPFLNMGLSRESFVTPLIPIIVIWFGVLAVLRPASGLLVYVFAAVASMPYQFLVLRGKSVSGGIFLSQVLLAALLFAWVMRYAARTKGDRRAPLPLLVPLIGLAVAPFVSVFSAYVTWDPEVSILHRKLVVQFAGASLIFLAVAAAMLTSAVVRNVSHAKSLIGIMAAIAAFSFFDVFHIFNTPGKSLMFTMAPLAFSFALHSTNRRRGFLWLTLLIPPFVIAVEAIKITFLVALLVPMLFISLAHSRRALLLTFAGLISLYLILGFAIGRSPALKMYEKAKIVKDFDRLVLFQKAAATWKSHPLFGVGPGGQFAYLGGEHYYGTTHSLYGNFLMETGVVGMVFLLWVIGGAVLLGWRTYRSLPAVRGRQRENPEAAFVRAFVLGQTGGFLGMAAAGLLSDTLLPAVQNGGMYMFGASVYMWILLGVTAAFRRMQQEGSIGSAQSESTPTPAPPPGGYAEFYGSPERASAQ